MARMWLLDSSHSSLCRVTMIPIRMPMGVLRLRTIMYTISFIFLTPLVSMSVPTQKTMGTACIAMAAVNIQTPSDLLSRPMAMPSNRLCTERAMTTRMLLREPRMSDLLTLVCSGEAGGLLVSESELVEEPGPGLVTL